MTRQRNIGALLYPADLLEPTRVDEHFRAEASAARAAGVAVQLVDHDAIVAGDAAGAVRRVSEADGLARGDVRPRLPRC